MSRPRLGLRAGGCLVVLAALAGASAPASSSAPTIAVTLDRLTYIDGASRSSSQRGFAWLGFDAARSSEALPFDAPSTRTAHTAAPGPAVENFESVTVDLTSRGDLSVSMIGRRTETLDPHAAPNSASEGGITKGRRVRWHIADAEPGTYTFTARYQPRPAAASVNTFLPEARIALRRGTRSSLLVFEQHAAPAYGEPTLKAGRVYGSFRRVPRPDEWVAQPSYVARGNYHWSAGAVRATRDIKLSKLAPGGSQFSAAGMATGYSESSIGPKIIPIFKPTFGDCFRCVSGFRYGVKVTEPVEQLLFPYQGVRPLSGSVYDGDAGTYAIGMSAASVHAGGKRPPSDDRGKLVWDWDGAVAEGWSTKDEHHVPASERLATEPVLVQETVAYARASGGDIDNRAGRRAVKGERLIVDLPNPDFAIIFSFGSYPRQANYYTEDGFTKDGRFFIRPTIQPGGYMLEGTTNGYRRSWQAVELLSVISFRLYPKEEPTAARVFTVPRGMEGRLLAATTDGMMKRLKVRPGVWQVVVTRDTFDIRPLRVF